MSPANSVVNPASDTRSLCAWFGPRRGVGREGLQGCPGKDWCKRKSECTEMLKNAQALYTLHVGVQV